MKMKIKTKFKFQPVYWSIIFFIVAQILTLVIVSRENSFFQANDIYIPPQPPAESISLWPAPPPATTTPETPAPVPIWNSVGPILIYFFSVVIVLGIILFLVPMKILRNILKAVFALMFAWGVFIVLVFWTPVIIAVAVALSVGLFWLFLPRVWLHNAVMIVSMVALGVVFGRLISPWTAMLLLIVIAIYDFFAVRFGYMVWMAGKLSESNTLPAFFIPQLMSEWKASLKPGSVNQIINEPPADRRLAILGGGDIAFPLLLVASAYFAYGLPKSILLAGFSLLGLIAAYWIQAVFLKGKAMPALPPIAVLAFIGILVIR
jgi:presenilin-like A22 family membrane protease